MIFSDIHNNLPALERVLADAQPRGVDAYYCLGDIGNDECVDLTRQVATGAVFGNLEVSSYGYLQPDNKAWVLQLPPIIRLENFWLTHAAPFWPNRIKTLADMQANPHLRVKNNLFPYLHYEQDSLWEAIATLTEGKSLLMFHGHTHRQLTWRFTNKNKLLRLHKPEFELNRGETYVVGVGSVGRPHDGPGASYVIYDDAAQTIEMIRVMTA